MRNEKKEIERKRGIRLKRVAGIRLGCCYLIVTWVVGCSERVTERNARTLPEHAPQSGGHASGRTLKKERTARQNDGRDATDTHSLLHTER
ncbi:hypothetical protein AMEX_G7937 [Astyanax mexicanus]|uniref:Uncharacterized protein n=1 Tax=Astyanax mexicanus TaxID=7994 RepID=A0A8T2M2G8_ASTMX|nr:hypothetical protein AMEX_G7937 [Astyanax mexicanus]